MRTRWLSAIVSLVIVAAPFISAQDQGLTFHWKGKLAPNNVIEIKNLNGEIDAQPANGDEVEVTAEKSGPQAAQVKIEVAQHSDGVTICAIYPSMRDEGNCEQSSSHSHGQNDAKVEFHVRVPANIRFSAKNVNGAVRADDLGSVIRAESVNGSVHVSTRAWAEASSVNGGVEASMGSADWTGTLRISTVNGSVHLQLPSNANTDVEFKSVNGRLESDFPLNVQGRMGGHSVSGRIGNGGRELSVETVNGSVELKRAGI